MSKLSFFCSSVICSQIFSKYFLDAKSNHIITVSSRSQFADQQLCGKQNTSKLMKIILTITVFPYPDPIFTRPQLALCKYRNRPSLAKLALQQASEALGLESLRSEDMNADVIRASCGIPWVNQSGI
jgi:hypothetical protein